jgi:hypothetical protein
MMVKMLSYKGHFHIKMPFMLPVAVLPEMVLLIEVTIIPAFG